ncbi:DUF2846 domain-containing protein [Aeromonas sp. 23P]|uniref:DUF2846 domain-containing protein n=1 Tax=Aeromonas sp. 23P TaxID=3452716 RepID=UPI003F7A6373
MRKLFTVFMAMTFLMLGGCSSLPEQNPNDPAIVQAKSFSPAPEGKAHVYIYRDSWLNRLHPMDVYLNDKILGDSYNKSFFLLNLDAGKSYKLGSESEFGNNELVLNAESGKTYYVRHYTRLGIVFPQSDLKLLTEPKEIEDAQKSITESHMNTPKQPQG